MSALAYAVTRKPALTGIARHYFYNTKRLVGLIQCGQITRNDNGQWSSAESTRIYVEQFIQDNRYRSALQ